MCAESGEHRQESARVREKMAERALSKIETEGRVSRGAGTIV